MPFSNKERLYVALYARGGNPTMPGGEDKYHWALVLGPKMERYNSRGTRFHAHEKMHFADGEARSVWEFEERDMSMAPTAMILVRILIAKVKDRNGLLAVLRSIPIRESQPGWNCVYWVQEAIQALYRHQESGYGIFERSAYQLDWDAVLATALWYVKEKQLSHRFDGQAASGTFDQSKVATWDMLQKRERIP